VGDGRPAGRGRRRDAGARPASAQHGGHPGGGPGDGRAGRGVRRRAGVADNPDANRYEARLGDRVAAFSAYRRIGDRLVFLHTETDPAFEGRGVGSRLVREALDDVRRRDLRVTAKCPFVAAWLRRHPGYEDLIAG
jgi:predicted GNAT family acetyltransferase